MFDILHFINEKDYQKNLVFALGQNIYTSVNTDAEELIDDDRPYAGWLHLGIGVVWKDADVRNSLVLDIGVVGPASQAEQVQDIIHDLRGFDSPNGWDNQLDNEIAFDGCHRQLFVKICTLTPFSSPHPKIQNQQSSFINSSSPAPTLSIPTPELTPLPLLCSLLTRHFPLSQTMANKRIRRRPQTFGSHGDSR